MKEILSLPEVRFVTMSKKWRCFHRNGKTQNCHYNGVILKYTCFHFIKFHVSTPYKSHSERNAKFLLKQKLEASCFQFLKKAIENKWIYDNVIFCYTHCIHRNCHLKFLLVYRNIISMWLERHRIQYFYIRWLYIIFIKILSFVSYYIMRNTSMQLKSFYDITMHGSC